MSNIKEFIEAVDANRRGERITFKVSHRELRDFFTLSLGIPQYRDDRLTIELDQEDLDYLYNKYFPQLEGEIAKEREIKIRRKQEEVHRKAKELEKLTRELNEIR